MFLQIFLDMICVLFYSKTYLVQQPTASISYGYVTNWYIGIFLLGIGQKKNTRVMHRVSTGVCTSTPVDYHESLVSGSKTLQQLQKSQQKESSERKTEDSRRRFNRLLSALPRQTAAAVAVRDISDRRYEYRHQAGIRQASYHTWYRYFFCLSLSQSL